MFWVNASDGVVEGKGEFGDFAGHKQVLEVEICAPKQNTTTSWADPRVSRHFGGRFFL